jgi:hypothetical protein
MSRSVKEWLELYALGPDLEGEGCRNCGTCMHAVGECAVFCHDCAQEFLPLLVEAHAKALNSARVGWDTARMVASGCGRNVVVRTAALELAELGNA